MRILIAFKNGTGGDSMVVSLAGSSVWNGYLLIYPCNNTIHNHYHRIHGMSSSRIFLPPRAR